MAALSGWQNFYVIVGSSAGALIGLQFVLITLIANIPARGPSPEAGDAFATPTIVHFSAVLLLAAAGTAPWPSSGSIAAFWGALGLFGVLYTVIVIRRMFQQRSYRPEFEDWLFHAILPLAAYAAIASSAPATLAYVRPALFTVAGSAMLLLFIGIHNAWDAATYHVFVVRNQHKKQGEGQK